MSTLEEFVVQIARRHCEAASFYGETSTDQKCLDLNYNEETDPAELVLCDPCHARATLKWPSSSTSPHPESPSPQKKTGEAPK